MTSWFFVRILCRRGHVSVPRGGSWVARLRQAYGTTENSRRRNEKIRTDFARFLSVWIACQLFRRSVAGFAITTSFQRDQCDSFSARDTQVGSVLCLHVRHLFGSNGSRTVRHGKGAHEYNLTSSFPRMRTRSTRERSAWERSLLVVGGQG